MAEITAAERWLAGVLKSDGDLISLVNGRVYANRVPSTGSYPCILFAFYHPGPDLYAAPDVRVLSSLRYIVRGIVEGESTIAVQPIADAIDRLLQASGGSNVDGVIGNCIREQPFFMPEDQQVGQVIKSWRHLGGIYRLTVQPNE